MSRQNQDLAAKVLRPESTHQLEARHPRHTMISDNNVKRSGGSADLNECLPATSRPGYRGRRTSKYHCDHVRDGFFILDNQNLQRVAHDFRDLISRTWAAACALMRELIVIGYQLSKAPTELVLFQKRLSNRLRHRKAASAPRSFGEGGGL